MKTFKIIFFALTLALSVASIYAMEKKSREEWEALHHKLQEKLKTENKKYQDLEDKYKKKMTEIEALHKSGVSKETLQKKYDEEIAYLEYQLQNQYQQRERLAREELAKIIQRLKQ